MSELLIKSVSASVTQSVIKYMSVSVTVNICDQQFQSIHQKDSQNRNSPKCDKFIFLHHVTSV